MYAKFGAHIKNLLYIYRHDEKKGMSKTETMDLYNKLFTQEKIAVNRLLRALASGNLEKAELSSQRFTA